MNVMIAVKPTSIFRRKMKSENADHQNIVDAYIERPVAHEKLVIKLDIDKHARLTSCCTAAQQD
jgi:hypothetical protein